MAPSSSLMSYDLRKIVKEVEAHSLAPSYPKRCCTTFNTSVRLINQRKKQVKANDFHATSTWITKFASIYLDTNE